MLGRLRYIISWTLRLLANDDFDLPDRAASPWYTLNPQLYLYTHLVIFYILVCVLCVRALMWLRFRIWLANTPCSTNLYTISSRQREPIYHLNKWFHMPFYLRILQLLNVQWYGATCLIRCLSVQCLSFPIFPIELCLLLTEIGGCVIFRWPSDVDTVYTVPRYLLIVIIILPICRIWCMSLFFYWGSSSVIVL